MKNFDSSLGFVKVVRSGDLISYTAEEGVRILGEGKFLLSDSFPGNERTKYCLTSKVHLLFYIQKKATSTFYYFFVCPVSLLLLS